MHEELGRQDWVEIGKKLTWYAYCKLGKAIISGDVPSNELRRQKAEDIAEDAIVSVISGDRNWDPEKHDLVGFLMSVVDSKTSHFLLGGKNRIERPFPETGLDAQTAEGPDIAVVYKDIRERLEPEADLMEMLDAMWAGCRAAGELAEWLGITPEEAVNIRKRLRRRVEDMGYVALEASR